MSTLDNENDLKRRVAEYLSALCEEIASGQTFHGIPLIVRDGQMAMDINAYGWYQVLGMKMDECRDLMKKMKLAPSSNILQETLNALLEKIKFDAALNEKYPNLDKLGDMKAFSAKHGGANLY